MKKGIIAVLILLLLIAAGYNYSQYKELHKIQINERGLREELNYRRVLADNAGDKVKALEKEVQGKISDMQWIRNNLRDIRESNIGISNQIVELDKANHIAARELLTLKEQMKHIKTEKVVIDASKPPQVIKIEVPKIIEKIKIIEVPKIVEKTTVVEQCCSRRHFKGRFFCR